MLFFLKLSRASQALSRGQQDAIVEETNDSLPVLSNDRVKVVSTGVLCQFGDSDRGGRSGLNSSIGDGSSEPGDNVVWDISLPLLSIMTYGPRPLRYGECTGWVNSQSTSPGCSPAAKGPPC